MVRFGIFGKFEVYLLDTSAVLGERGVLGGVGGWFGGVLSVDGMRKLKFSKSFPGKKCL